jgi:hypothetical protein
MVVNRGSRSIISKSYFIIQANFQNHHAVLKRRNATTHKETLWYNSSNLQTKTFQIVISNKKTRDNSVSRILLRNGWSWMHSSYIEGLGEFSSPPSPDWFAVNPNTLLAGNTLCSLSRVKRLQSLNDYSFLSSELVKSCTKFLFPSPKPLRSVTHPYMDKFTVFKKGNNMTFVDYKSVIIIRFQFVPHVSALYPSIIRYYFLKKATKAQSTYQN